MTHSIALPLPRAGLGFRRLSLTKLLQWALAILVAVVAVFPIWWMVNVVFAEPGMPVAINPRLFPTSFGAGVAKVATIFRETSYFHAYYVSLAYTLLTIAGVLLFGSMAAFEFALFDFPGKKILFAMVMLSLMVPTAVTLIPTYLLTASLGWLNTMQGLVVPGLASAFGLFMLTQFMKSIPREMLDAAYVDGANHFQTYRYVALPLSVNVLVTLAILTFMRTWGNFIWPLVVAPRQEMYTVSQMVGLFNAPFSHTTVDVVMTANLLAALPPLIFFLVFQRKIVEGIATSGDEGMTDLEVGVDIGGTKTHLRIRGTAAPERERILPTADWRVRDWEKDSIALLALARSLAGDSGIAAMAVGAHGCDDASECEAFRVALAGHTTFPVSVVNDAELLPAALGYEHQIGLVAGTGSIAVCRDPLRGMMVAGGWGWVIGDEGSASGLVREAARAVSLHLDAGGALSEPLAAMLVQGLGLPNAARLGSAIAALGGSAELGRHAPLVFAAEASGSLLATQVIRDGATRLVDLVAHLRERGSLAKYVVAGGGVIVAQPGLANAFLEELDNRFAGALTAGIYAGPPVEGACRLAATLRSRASHTEVTSPPAPSPP